MPIAKAPPKAPATLKARIQGAEAAHAPTRPLVAPSPEEPKSGCLFCPLLPFSKDFDGLRPRFQRDAAKILNKTRYDSHVVHGRAVGSGVPWPPVDLLFVGEAPGQEEDHRKEAFIGKSGTLLRETVSQLIGLPPDRVAYTNVVRCRPPRNKEPNQTMVRCCSYELVREIQARQPRLVVALGNTSLEFLTGQTGISSLAGRILDCTHPEFPDLKVLACLHPAYILRMDFLAEPWCEALARAEQFLSGKYTPPPGLGTYHTLTTIGAVETRLREIVAQGDVAAFDTETGSLSCFQTQFPRLLCVSVTNAEQVGYTIPFDHPDSPWREGGPRASERPRLVTALRAFFLSACPKIAQNEKFDRQHIRQALGVEPANVVRDTMLTHYVLDETRGTHGLKKLAFVYTGMGGYDRPLDTYIGAHLEANPERGGSYANIPGALLFPYAGMDVDATLRVDRALRAVPEWTKHPKLRALAEQFYPELSRVLADMEYAGAQVDAAVVERLDRKYRKEMATHAAAIQALPKVQAFVVHQQAGGKTGKRRADPFEFNPGSPTQLALLLFEHYGERPEELTESGLEILSARWKRAYDRWKLMGGTKPKFEDTVQTAIDRREWSHFSTKADVLHEYERRGNTLCPILLKYREAAQIHGTFIEPLLGRLDAQGRVHGSYLCHGTATGRLSSQAPNLQNIPDAAKPAYVSRFGAEGLILSVDYSQIELRVAACWFNDPDMIRAYVKGIDLHALTAAQMHGLTLEKFLALPKAKQKEWRTQAKRINFGIIYGAGPPALQATLKKDGIHVTLEVCEDFLAKFFQVRPNLKRGIERMEQQTIVRGWLEVFTGRRRRVPAVKSDDREIRGRALRQSINAPIQGGASEMTLMSLCLIHRVMQAEGFRSKLILTVHDSLVFDCHVDEMLAVATLAKDIMEHITELSDEILPGLDWSWLRCPVVADVEVGHSWGATVKFDPATVQGPHAQAAGVLWGEKDGKRELAREPVTVDELWEAMAWRATVV
jgi:DNA polymerase-1